MRRRRAVNIGLSLAGAAILGTNPMVATANSPKLTRRYASLRTKLVNALARANNTGCSEAAALLRTASVGRTVSLHLRGIGLTAQALEQVTHAIRALNRDEARLLASVSVSYNHALSDAGA